MTKLRKRSVIAFAAFGLLGPLIRLATWPPSSLFFGSIRLEGLVYDLVFYLWLTQPLAVYESEVGTTVAGMGALLANVLLCALLGVAIGEIASRCFSLRLAYGILACGLGAYAVWGAGFDVTYIGFFPFAIALALYAIPVWVIAKSNASENTG
jgi:hypothetical protein